MDTSEILTLLRQGWQVTQIARERGLTVEAVIELRDRALSEIRPMISDSQIINHLRFEDLWSQVVTKIEASKKVAVFAKLVALGVTVLQAQQKALGTADPVVGKEKVESVEAQLRRPTRFATGKTTLNVATGSRSPASTQ